MPHLIRFDNIKKEVSRYFKMRFLRICSRESLHSPLAHIYNLGSVANTYEISMKFVRDGQILHLLHINGRKYATCENGPSQPQLNIS